MSRAASLWALAAVCGLLLAGGIGWATSRLTGQHIGLSSEPLTAGRSLAPPTVTKPVKQGRSSTTGSKKTGRTLPGKQTTSTPTAVTSTPIHTTPTQPAEAQVPSEQGTSSPSTRGGSHEDGGGGATPVRSGAGRDD